MIRHHVSQGACRFIEAAAMLHPHGLRRGDLHMVHVIAVPQGFDDVVRKAEDHYVLRGLFAEIVIDAIDLLFRQNLLQFLVELLRRFQVVAERLFDDHPRPVAVFFFRQFASAEHFCDRREKSRRYRQIEESVSERVMNLVRLFNLFLQPLVGLGVLKIAADVIHALSHPVPALELDWRCSVLGYLFAQHLPKTFGGVIVRGEAHNGELLWKKIVRGEIAQRGNQFAFCQIASCAKNDHDAGRRSGIRIRMVQVHEWDLLPARVRRLSKFLVTGFLLDVPAKLKAHRGQNLRREIVFAA